MSNACCFCGQKDCNSVCTDYSPSVALCLSCEDYLSITLYSTDQGENMSKVTFTPDSAINCFQWSLTCQLLLEAVFHYCHALARMKIQYVVWRFM